MPILHQLSKLTNAQKIALIIFFSSLYFYSHVGTLYLQIMQICFCKSERSWYGSLENSLP
jgi:hypothetical protein